MGYGLSVDLGTTYTAAATLEPGNGGRPEVLGLGNRALQIPSVVYLLPDGQALVGEAAERRAFADPSRVAREFKRRIGDPIPIVVAGSPYSAQSLTARLLRAVVDAAADVRGGPADWVVLTHPANWGPFKIDLLQQAAELADVDGVRLCMEPVAAALQYAATYPVAVAERVCVFDLGGGTFDACVLQRTAEGFEILGRPDGVEHLGGADFDEAVFRHVLRALEAASADPLAVDAQDPALARLRRDCVDAKEALSADPETVVVANLAGRSTPVRLTRAELEEMIRPAIQEALDATVRALRSAQVAPADLRTFVLIGGSSRIPLVAEMLMAAFGRPVARTTNPKHDVVLGALWTGPGVVLPPAAHTGALPPGPTLDGPPTTRLDTTAPADAGTARRRTSGDGLAATPHEPTGPPDDPTTRLSAHSARGAPDPDSARRRRTLLTVGGAALAVVALVGAIVYWPRAGAPDGNADGGRGSVAVSTTVPGGSSADVPVTEPTPGISNDPTPSVSTSSSPAVPGFGLPQSAEPLPENTVIAVLSVDGVDGQYPVDSTTGALGPRIPATWYEKVAISPDRRSVVYLAHDDGRTLLRVIGVDGSGDRPLFPEGHPDCEQYRTPAWNPVHQEQIAVTCFVVRPNPEKPDDPAEEDFSMLVFSVVDGSLVTRIPVDLDFHDGLSWSPDGERLAFFARERNGRHSLYDIAADGSERVPTRLTDGFDDYDPMWSADAAVAFRRLAIPDPTRPIYDIDVLTPASGGQVRRIPSDSDDNEIDPSWSPDGTQLVYRSSRDLEDSQQYRYWIADADGADARLLIDHPALAPAAWGRR